MKAKCLILLIISSIQFVSCYQKENDYSQVPRLYITEKDISGELKASDFLQNVSLIPLETSNNSYISEIYKIQQYQDNYYYQDKYGASTVLSFDKEGRFVRGYGHKGNRPGEYVLPMDFYLDSIKNEMVIINSEVHQLNIYNLANGNFIKSIAYFNPIHEINKVNNQYVLGGAAHEKRLLFCDSNMILRKALIPYTPLSGVGLVNKFMVTNKKDLIFRISYNDTIYKVLDKSIYPYLIVDFGEKRLTDQDISKLTPSQLSHFSEYVSEKMCNIIIYAENANTRVIEFSFKRKTFVCFQDKHSKHLKVFPVDQYIDDMTLNSTFATIVGIDSEGNFLASLSSDRIISGNKKILSDKNSYPNQKISPLAGKISMLSNPTLLKFTIKTF